MSYPSIYYLRHEKKLVHQLPFNFGKAHAPVLSRPPRCRSLARMAAALRTT